MMMISTISTAQMKIPSVEPISRSISTAVGVGVGTGFGLGEMVAPEPKAALKKARLTPMMTNKTVRAEGDSFFINSTKV